MACCGLTEVDSWYVIMRINAEFWKPMHVYIAGCLYNISPLQQQITEDHMRRGDGIGGEPESSTEQAITQYV
jgi:hypothetical protein